MTHVQAEEALLELFPPCTTQVDYGMLQVVNPRLVAQLMTVRLDQQLEAPAPAQQQQQGAAAAGGEAGEAMRRALAAMALDDDQFAQLILLLQASL